MRILLTFTLVVSGLLVAATQASAQVAPLREARDAARRARAELRALFQERRGPELTDTVSRKLKLGRDGRVTIQNVAGDIVVTAGSGDDVSIEAVKRTRGDRSELGRVEIIIEEHTGRVDVRTDHHSLFRGDHVSVDYTVTVPDSASVELKSVSGHVKVNGVKGRVRAESVSGNVTTSGAPRVESVKSVSGDVEISDASTDGELSASSISGRVRANGVKLRSLELSTISGALVLRDIACERLSAHSVSGGIEYSGTLAKGGRYELNSHSGSLRLGLSGNTGFELSATSFSGSVRSELPLTVGGDRNPDVRRRGFGRGRGGIQATFGDGSATLTARTFSGDIVLTRR
jgi:DUF4097 and DUF4098 domain-containing protein YvlB